MSSSHEPSTFLAHYGVKGMKWGVRKSASSSGDGWNINSDGSIDIQPGTTLSRVVRNHSGLFGGKGLQLDTGVPVYAAFKPNDVAGYEHFFGRGKSLLVKDASTVLQLTATNSLKAPGPKESAAIYYDLMNKNPALKEQLRSNLPVLSKRAFDKALKDPTSTQAYGHYSIVLDSSNYNAKTSEVNRRYFAEVKKAGYNMLLDPSDAYGGFDAPVMILDGGKNLSIKGQHVVDKVSAEKARLAYKKTQTKEGKLYLEQQGYL